jgi:hypothetical protein
VTIRRRDLLKAAGVAAVGQAVTARPASAFVPAHNWDRYDWGIAPTITDRLYQGPFPETLVPSWDVVMAVMPSNEIVPNYGMGLITYVWDEAGQKKTAKSLEQSIEDLVAYPLGTSVYIRVDWRHVHKGPGRFDPDPHWKLTFDAAKRHGKRVAFRIQLGNPNIPTLAMPDFVQAKVPLVKMGDWSGKTQYEPRYDHPEYQAAFADLLSWLSICDGSPAVEYVDTMMYGFWGEGHTWPFENPRHPFPDSVTAERTFVKMFEAQQAAFKKTPLVTNTQPDFSHVGNSELLDRTIRSFNWLRTDTIFIENEQIEALSNRPPWTGATIEVGTSDGSPESLKLDDGVPHTENVIAHVKDVGAHYFSLWNWQHISAEGLKHYYDQYPAGYDALARRIGYRVRPSWVWRTERDGHPSLVIGFANDGIAGVPGALRVRVTSPDGRVNVSGSLDPGYPLPGKVRQALFPLPDGTDWKGLRVSAELEVKGVRYPVRWACRQKLNDDGSLTLRPTPGVSDVN